MLELLCEIVHWAMLIEDFDPVIVQDCTFKKDFGPWRARDRAYIIQVAVTDEGVWLEEVSAAGNSVHKVLIHLEVENA